MSSGHSHSSSSPQISLQSVEGLLNQPKVRALYLQKPKLNFEFDIPYLAGYSKDGKTIYFDCHLPRKLKVGGRLMNLVPSLTEHEHVEKSLIDALGYKYAPAHNAATVAEHRVVRAEGFLPSEYEKALRPFIKADAIERIKRAPADLDLTPYIDSHDFPVLFHLRGLLQKNALDAHRIKK